MNSVAELVNLQIETQIQVQVQLNTDIQPFTLTNKFNQLLIVRPIAKLFRDISRNVVSFLCSGFWFNVLETGICRTGSRCWCTTYLAIHPHPVVYCPVHSVPYPQPVK